MDSAVSNILLNMSSAFREAIPDNEKLTLNEDETLKWRGLLNNTYAAKDGRELRKRSASVKELSGGGSTAETVDDDGRENGGDTSSGGVNGGEVKETICTDNNSEDNNEQNDSTSADDKTALSSKQKGEKTEQNVNAAVIGSGSGDCVTTTLSPDESTSNTATTSTKHNDHHNETSNINVDDSVVRTDNMSSASDKSHVDKTRIKTRTATKITALALQSDRSLRSKTNPDNGKSGVSPITTIPTVGGNKRGSRGRNKKSEASEDLEVQEMKPEVTATIEAIIPVPDKPSKPECEASSQESEKRDNEKPRLIMKIRQNRSVVLPTSIDVMQPKKRGRKPRMQLIPLGRKTRSTKDIEMKNIISQRPMRRIKPTPKILASDELHEDFVQKHCARLSGVAADEMKHEQLDEANKPKSINDEPDKRLTRDKKRRELSNSNKLGCTEKTPPLTTLAENSDGKKMAQTKATATVDSRSIKRSLSFSESMRNVAKRPCPDPSEFLREIKNSKLNIHRSPELSKLNKKQLKKLQRNKEKHFHTLGLQKVKRPNDTDTEDNSDENEEFLPKRRVENVGRSQVTLRLRTFRKDFKDGAGRNGDQSMRKKRQREAMLVSSAGQSVPLKKIAPANIATTTTVAEIDLTNELQVVPAGPSNTVIDVDDMRLICFCAQPSKYFLQRTAAISHCCAIDEIEGQKIGCTNEVHGDLLQLLRPSVRTSYMVLCDSHKKRLVSHNCCAGCGIFLTQGIFSLCPDKHFFHRDCTMKYILNAPYDPNSPDFQGPTLAFKCPHCGADTPDNSFRVTMKSENTPVFFTNQKHHVQRAKMSITNRPQVSANSFMLNVEQLIPDTVIDILQKISYQIKHQPPKLFTAKDLFHAICNDSGAEKIAEIIASGFDITKPFKEFNNGTCLHLVSTTGKVTTLYLILCRASNKDFINMMDKEKRTAVMCAVVSGKNDILKVLVHFGADITLKGPDGMSALHLAAKVGNFAAVQIILDFYRQSASILKTEQFLNMTDNGHWTALVWAAEVGYADIVTYFISLGADVNICDRHSNTVLHWAALSGKIDTIYPLMLPHMHFNRQNINGDTALHIACRQANTRICLVLVANGANLYIKNDAGEMPYDCVPQENSQCARVLRFNMDIRKMGEYKEPKIIQHDISNGREYYPIQMVQKAGNDDAIVPSDFKYITKSILLQNTVQVDIRISQMRVCSCSDSCISDSCQCAQISIQNWYNSDGRLINEFNYGEPAMIFECNDVCGCNFMACKNRVVQRGSKLPFEVFECEDSVKGFGVRCHSKILKGTFVAEYIGEILTDAEADRRTDDSFFFDLGASEHCIDAKFYGNISRFFNHSCEANIVPIRVYFDHQDIRFPKIAFFANKDIEPQEELTFDYGTKFWLAKYKQFTCHCKTTSCRYSSTTILKTVEDFNQRCNSN